MAAVSRSEFILFSFKINSFEVAAVRTYEIPHFTANTKTYIVVSIRHIIMFLVPLLVGSIGACDRITHGTWLEHGSVKRKMQFISPDTS